MSEPFDALKMRVQEMTTTATPEQLVYLTRALELLTGQILAEDLKDLTDEKVAALQDLAQKSDADITTKKDAALTEIEQSQSVALANLDQQKTEAIQALETDLNAHLQTITQSKQTALSELDEKKEALNSEILSELARFDQVNDLPNGTTFSQALSKATPLPTTPILFGVLCRKAENYGNGVVTTELGKWTQEGSDAMLSLLCGCSDDFYAWSVFPKACQNFMYKNMVTVYESSTTTGQRTYPHACLGCVFVKNTTDQDIERTLSFGGSCSNSEYGGLSLSVGTPGNESLQWEFLYTSTTQSDNQNAQASITIPAQTTIVILLYTSAYPTYSANYFVNFFEHFYFQNLDEFLGNGLEIDRDKTLEAWQCKGLTTPFQLWEA